MDEKKRSELLKNVFDSLTDEQKEKAKACKTVEELTEMLTEAGVELSDELLEALFPRNQILFLMCQSGGRVSQLMTLLKARGWDMTKVYNIGGMAQYAGAEYRDIVTDTPEITISATYTFEGLTRIAP